MMKFSSLTCAAHAAKVLQKLIVVHKVRVTWCKATSDRYAPKTYAPENVESVEYARCQRLMRRLILHGNTQRTE